jgi:hypothetical protein
LPRFAIILAVALTVWLWPSIFDGKVLLPLDIMSHTPPFSPDTVGPIHNELIGDMLYENFAWKTFQRECITHGELPLWTPYAFCGHPIYTTGQTATFYPLNAIFWIVPIPYAYVVYTWLHLFGGGLFAYLFFRRVGVSGFGASVGGIMFAMSTYLAVRFIWPMLLGSAVWLPLMLLWTDWVAGLRTRRALLWGVPVGAVLFALPILSGFFEIAFYVLFACGLYTVVLGVGMLCREWSWVARVNAFFVDPCRPHKGLDGDAMSQRFHGSSGGSAAAPTTCHPRAKCHRRAAVVFFATVGGTTLLAVVLALPQLLPFFEVMDRNVRAGELSYEEAIKNGLTLKDAITFVSPDALGDPSEHDYYSLADRGWKPICGKNGQDFHYFGTLNYVEATNYLGLLPLAFVAISPLAAGRRRVYFWLLLTVSLALAFATPVYWVFFHFVPGTDQVRTPFRWTLLTMFACTYLAAIGADDWHVRLSAAPRRFTQVVAAGKTIAVAILAGVVFSMFAVPGHLTGVAERIMAADPRAASTFASPADLADLLWANAARFMLFGLLAVILVAAAYWRAWGPKAIATFSVAAVALVAVDLGQATYRFNTHAEPAILETVPPIVQYMRNDARADIFRIGRFGWQKTFYSNLPTLYGLQDYGGYDSIILKDFAKYMQAIEPQKLLPYNIVMNFEQKSSLDSPLFRLLNIRYLLSVKPLDHPDYEPVDVPGNLKLSRIKPEKELPRAFMVGHVHAVPGLDAAIKTIQSGQFDVRQAATVQTSERLAVRGPTGPAGEARIAEYRTSRVRIETSAADPQLLVLCDVYYPGWRAYVDGQPTDIMAVNGIFRGVSVPAGKHTVDFRFEPAPLRIGGTLSLACLGGLILVLGIGLWRGRQRGNTPPRAVAGVS